jgi:hypothetical protein
MKFPVSRRFEGNHRVIKFLALGAQNRLNDDVPAAIRAARHADAITAFGTFKEITAAHKPFFGSLSGATADSGTVRWGAVTDEPAREDARPTKDSTCLYSVTARPSSLFASLRAKTGGLAGTRTLDQCLKRALLYQLSYQPLKEHHPKKAAKTRKVFPGLTTGKMTRYIDFPARPGRFAVCFFTVSGLK